MRVWLMREVLAAVIAAIFCVLRRTVVMGFFLTVMCVSCLDVQAHADEILQDDVLKSGMYGRIIAGLMDTLQLITDENSTAKLADGSYTPDRFGYSGGTGRVTISCEKVTVREGRAYASLVFDSGSYSYVRVNERVYEGTNTADTSIFEVLVQLNRNNTIIGCTTKMSSAHEIAYSIFIYIEAASDDPEDLPGDGGLSQEELSKEAPKLAGLTFERETPVGNAKLFKIFHYKGGITCIEVDLGIDAGKEMEGKVSERGTKPYSKRIVRYLIVQDKTEVPAGLDKEMVVIRRPGKKDAKECFHVYAACEPALEWMEELGQLKNLSFLGIPEEECRIRDVRKLLEEEEIIFAGTYEDMEYKALVAGKCDLALMPAEILSSETDMEGAKELSNESHETYTEAAGYLSELGIPMFVDRSSREKSQEGQAEWIKVYGVLFDREEEARALYQE